MTLSQALSLASPEQVRFQLSDEAVHNTSVRQIDFLRLAPSTSATALSGKGVSIAGEQVAKYLYSRHGCDD